MFEATMRELSEQGVTETPEVVLVDAGYWHRPQMQSISEQGIEVLVPPDGNMHEGKRRGWEEGVYQPGSWLGLLRLIVAERELQRGGSGQVRPRGLEVGIIRRRGGSR